MRSLCSLQRNARPQHREITSPPLRRHPRAGGLPLIRARVQDAGVDVPGRPAARLRHGRAADRDARHAEGLGVDRIRVSVFWRVLAPANDQLEKPNFDTTDPAAYQAQVWEQYDALIRGRAGARHPREPELHVAGPALGLDGVAARRHPGDVQPQPGGVRQVRPRGRHALQRQLQRPAARRLLVDLERAQPGRLADAAVEPRPAQRAQPDRCRAVDLPQPRRQRLAGAGRHRPRQPTRSSSARPRRRARATRRPSRSRSTR